MALKFANNQSLTSTTALPSAVPTDNLILISTQTASNSANISFTTGLNGTYDEYIFKFINIHPSGDYTFGFQGSTNGGSSYNTSITSTFFYSYHNEADNSTGLFYNGSLDQANGTSLQFLNDSVGSDNDLHCCGILTLFNPASTTYVKHWISEQQSGTTGGGSNPFSVRSFSAGYFNTTSAINAVQFKFNVGNIDDGIIKMYGVKKS